MAEQIEEPGKWAVVKVAYAADKKPYGRDAFLYDWFVRTDARGDAGCNWTNGSAWMHSWDEVLAMGEVEVVSPGPERAWDEGVGAAHRSPLTLFAIRQVNPYTEKSDG